MYAYYIIFRHICVRVFVCSRDGLPGPAKLIGFFCGTLPQRLARLDLRRSPGFFRYEGLLKDLWAISSELGLKSEPCLIMPSSSQAPITKDMVDQFRNLGGQECSCGALLPPSVRNVIMQ